MKPVDQLLVGAAAGLVFVTLVRNAGGWIEMLIELGLHSRPALCRLQQWHNR